MALAAITCALSLGLLVLVLRLWILANWSSLKKIEAYILVLLGTLSLMIVVGGRWSFEIQGLFWNWDQRETLLLLAWLWVVLMRFWFKVFPLKGKKKDLRIKALVVFCLVNLVNLFYGLQQLWPPRILIQSL